MFGSAQGATTTDAVLNQPSVSTPDERPVLRPGRTQRECSAELDYNDGTEASVSSGRISLCQSCAIIVSPLREVNAYEEQMSCCTD